MKRGHDVSLPGASADPVRRSNYRGLDQKHAQALTEGLRRYPERRSPMAATNGRVHNETWQVPAQEALNASDAPVIAVTDLVKDYSRGSNVVHALRTITLQVRRGEFVTIMGPSGSGKSTFMNVVGCLDRPTSGSYLLDGVDVTGLSSVELSDLRNIKLGFIFQGFNLLPRMDALDNVMLPMVYAGVSGHIRQQRAHAALEAVGLEDRAHHRPNEMSGGQQQRVAIARALVNAPSLILADEPTGNLDSRTGVEIMSILQRLNQAGATILLVTHEHDIATFSSRTVAFKDGVIVSDQRNRSVALASETMAAWPASTEAG
jgi:putative ABC transport system ATP-binding protein